MSEVRKYIGDVCYVCLFSKAELVSADEKLRIPLSVTEYKILTYFIEQAEKPVYLEALARHIWGIYADEKDPNSLKSQISRVRNKLNKVSEGLNNCIETNFGLNSYTLRMPSSKRSRSTAHAQPASASFPKASPASTESSSPLHQNRGNTDVRQASYYDLLELGYTSLDIAEALVKNDWKLYGASLNSNGIAQENEGSAMQWAEFLSSVPDSFQYLLNANNEIVGNFSFCSISKEQEIAFLEGHLSESLFNPAETKDLFCAGDDHILFLLNLSLNDKYSTPRNNSLLRQMFLSQLLLFAQEDIMFCKIIVNVFKASHEAFYKQWGFSFVKQHRHSGRIYELVLRPYPDKLYQQLKKNHHLREINEQLKEIYGKQSDLSSAYRAR